MVAEELLPTGELVELAEGPTDLRQATPLQSLDLDHVVWGMTRAKPAAITYLKLNKRLVLHADDFFTHAVVYTPAGRPFFCIENQSCSTDAHNLHARGYPVAPLAILAPGDSLRTWAQFLIEKM